MQCLQFVYLTCRNGTEYKPMKTLLNGLHPDGFLRMVRNLLEVMQHVEETGFFGRAEHCAVAGTDLCRPGNDERAS